MLFSSFFQLEVHRCVLNSLPHYQLLRPSAGCWDGTYSLRSNTLAWLESSRLPWVSWVPCSAPKANPRFRAEHLQPWGTNPPEVFVSCSSSFSFILCLFGILLGTGFLADLCEVGREGTMICADLPLVILSLSCCGVDIFFAWGCLLWRTWRVWVWVSSGTTPSDDKPHTEL